MRAWSSDYGRLSSLSAIPSQIEEPGNTGLPRFARLHMNILVAMLDARRWNDRAYSDRRAVVIEKAGCTYVLGRHLHKVQKDGIVWQIACDRCRRGRSQSACACHSCRRRLRAPCSDLSRCDGERLSKMRNIIGGTFVSELSPPQFGRCSRIA